MKQRLQLFEQRILLFSVFILSLCGIIYELVLGSLATYLLGNPVQQYSITIGFFLSSMGLGSYLSRYFLRNLLKNFIMIEVALGFIGGVSILILSWLFSFSVSYYFLHIFFLVVIGMLVGLEIPLLTRILKRYGSLRDILSNVLTLDYIGGLAGSLLFPLVLFPFVGRMLTSIIVGVCNIGVAVVIIIKIDYPGKRRSDLAAPLLLAAILLCLALASEQVTGILHKRLYYDDIVFSRRSRFQEIVLTRNEDDFRLYLDGSLQFSSFDEYRYHEMLVFPALCMTENPVQDVLVLGGGDGLAVREVLKWDTVRRVVLVELDPVMIELARNNPSIRKINSGSMLDPRAEVVAGDAYAYLLKNRKKFDIIIADFPDPHDETIAKLYTVEFFRLIRRTLGPGGVFVTQSTSPLFASEAFWCINHTLSAVFKQVIPYHVYVPTFGDWGFNMAVMSEHDPKDIRCAVKGLRFFSQETFKSSLHFPADSLKTEKRINTFNRPVLYTCYIRGWKHSIEY